MSLQVLVTFPGSMTLGAFEDRINLLTKMGCSIHLGTDLARPLGQMSVGKVFKAKAAKDFNKLLSQKAEDAMTEELTPQEEALLDKGMQAIYDKMESPLLDSMGVFKPKLNVSHEIRTYFQENPGHSANQAAAHLANKFESSYEDINDAFKRIKNIICVLCAPNNPQHCLDRRGGRGDKAQIHLIA